MNFFILGWALLSAMAAALPAMARDRSPLLEPQRVFLIGIDGATWDVIKPMMERGELPHFKDLIRRGSSGVLLSTEPTHSPIIWTTIATGLTPEEHGITTYVMGANKRLTSFDRRAPAIWNLLSQRGSTVCVIGYFVTWPAEEVNGVIISDLSLDPAITFGKGYPDKAVEEYARAKGGLAAWEMESREGIEGLRRFIGFKWNPKYKSLPAGSPEYDRNDLVTQLLAWTYMRDETFVRMAEYFLPKVRPDLFMIHLWGIDHASHGFWKYMNPRDGVSREDVVAFGNVIPEYYRYVDSVLGRLVALADEHTTVVVVSDHGFGPGEHPDYKSFSGTHRLEGVFIAAGSAVPSKTSIQNASVFDIAPTLLHFLGFPTAKDMPGRVLTEIIAPSWLKDHPIRTITSYGRLAARPGKPALTYSPDEMELLRRLGYVQ